MKVDNITNKKILAGATAVVALSGFVPAINAASPTATANVGVSVIIQQAITINVGAPVNFGTIVISNTTVVGQVWMRADNNSIGTDNLTGEATLVGGNAKGSMAINSSAGAVNIAAGAAPTDDGGNISYHLLRLNGPANGSLLGGDVLIYASSNKTVTLVGNNFDIGANVKFYAKPTPGTYNTKSWTITVSDI